MNRQNTRNPDDELVWHLNCHAEQIYKVVENRK
jgi:hypothetical protein